MRLDRFLAFFILLHCAFATEKKCRIQLSTLQSQLEIIAREGLSEWNYPETLSRVLSAQARQALMNEAAMYYARATKKPTPDLFLAPRRALAAVVHSLSGSHLKLAQDLESGVDPFKAYNRYLKSIQKVYAPYLQTQAYSAEILADVAAIIINESEFSKIEIFGSLPNGRANFSSFDVDIYAMAPTSFFEDMRSLIVGGQHISRGIEDYFHNLEIPLQEQGISLTGVVSLDQMTRARPYFSYLFERAVLSSPVSVFATRREIRIRIYPRVATRGQVPREYFLRRL